MMWRLNFLVIMVCITLQNSYMLYYICPMHTLFTIMVYAALGIGHRYNKSNLGIACKYAALSLWQLNRRPALSELACIVKFILLKS